MLLALPACQSILPEEPSEALQSLTEEAEDSEEALTEAQDDSSIESAIESLMASAEEESEDIQSEEAEEPGEDPGQASTDVSAEDGEKSTESDISGTEDGSYSSKEEVALYLHTYGRRPNNYSSKTKAQKKGWDAQSGNLWDVCPGMSIGGGPFANREGILPDGDYKECDIDYNGGHRGAKRIVYSDDGRIYYTEDHYNTFEQLY
ncbi:MAG: ribonuclease [Lachnospiraceae bacterium]|nr:ribonuclease [Candidatus Equihabitans merdae]